jgi:DNA-3-methyladenine glycosylase
MTTMCAGEIPAENPWTAIPGRSPEPDFYAGTAVDVARRLIGSHLYRVFPDGTVAAGMIVETEAYRQDDPASHSFSGISNRNAVMFGRPGVAYVYLIYGVHSCLNVVCEPEGSGAAVLIRAVHPVHGLGRMWANRFDSIDAPADLTIGSEGRPANDTRRAVSAKIRNLTSGPGKVCQAFALSYAAHNGAWLGGPPETDSLTLVASDRTQMRHISDRVTASRRVGIRRAVDRLWRFSLADDPFVSRPIPEGTL